MVKIIGFLLGMFGVIFCTICGVYAYNNEMWYELCCCVGACVLCVYCGYLFTMCSKYVKDEQENEEDYF